MKLGGGRYRARTCNFLLVREIVNTVDVAMTVLAISRKQFASLAIRNIAYQVQCLADRRVHPHPCGDVEIMFRGRRIDYNIGRLEVINASR